MQGHDIGPKIKGKRQHPLVNAQGLPFAAIAHAADIQNRDGRVLLMNGLSGLLAFLLELQVAGCDQGPSSNSDCS